MTDTETLDIIQTAFLFNWISGSAGDKKGTSVELADVVYDRLCGETGLIHKLGSQLILNPDCMNTESEG
ncbi:MAG: hypothetical protein AAGG51_20660 [Cyanobacteria bacterium P01_G01_bin.54]